MDPSRLVALCFLVLSVLLLAQLGIDGQFALSFGTIFQLIGGVLLLLTGLYGVFRYEENPIVAEYGPLTYLLIFGIVTWALGILLQLLSG